MRSRSLLCFLAVLTAGSICFAQTSSSSASGSDEKTLWEIWKARLEKPDEPGPISTNCLEFVKKNPKDQLAPVAMTIAAWHILKTGNQDATVKLLKTVLSVAKTDTLLGSSAANMAKAWLTRLDMEQVKQALQLYYRKHIEYPKTLEGIKPFQKEGQPPLVDRWGKPWLYSLSEFQSLKKIGYGMYGQRYQLKSVLLGTNSTLQAAIKMPYAGGIPLKAVKVLNGTPGKEMVQFETTDGKQSKVILTIGAENGGIVMSYVGPKLLILADANHWQILPRPY